MRKRFRIVLVILLVAIVGGVVWAVLESREPVYQGRGLSAWMKDLTTGPIINNDYSGATHDAAVEAIRHMGTKALPQLLAGLGAKDSQLKVKLMRFFSQHPVFRIKLETADDRRGEAAQGFKALGAIARPAIPDLIPIVNDRETALESAFCLAFIGPEGVPPLIQALTNRVPRVRGYAAFALSYGPLDASPAVSALIQRLQDTNNNVMVYAVGTLMRMTNQSRLVIPALVANLGSTNAVVRKEMGKALVYYAAAGKGAMPTLIAMQNDPEPKVRAAVTNAIELIDADVAAKARGK
ncbi:MAG: repeat protein [Pedosphaera sp.]|nr:repeat protein [Pedosphaera sp.]